MPDTFLQIEALEALQPSITVTGLTIAELNALTTYLNPLWSARWVVVARSNHYGASVKVWFAH